MMHLVLISLNSQLIKKNMFQILGQKKINKHKGSLKNVKNGIQRTIYIVTIWRNS